MNIGDTVYLIAQHYGRTMSVKEATIDRKTPSGQMVLSNGVRLNSRGKIIGDSGDGSVYITTDMKDAEEARAELARRRIVSRVSAIKWNEYPDDVLQAVLSLIERKHDETKR